jgi:hypothetical protein
VIGALLAFLMQPLPNEPEPEPQEK